VTGGASLAFAYAGAGLFAYGAVGEIADQRVDMAWANFYLQKLKEAEAYYLSALEIYERAVSRLEQASGLGREAGLEAMIDNLSVDEGFLAEINQLLVFYYANTLLAEKIVHHVDILSARWARDELSGDIKDLLASMTTGLIGQAGLTYKYVFKGVEHVFQVSDSLAFRGRNATRFRQSTTATCRPSPKRCMMRSRPASAGISISFQMVPP
jgi:hypothetical protein